MMKTEKLDILYEDQALMVCYKPAGIAVETKRIGQKDMVSLLKNYRAQKGESPYIGVVHRLDQPVEGVMLFAKTPKAAAGLSAQIQKRSIGKKYYALVQLPEKNADFAKATGLEKEGTFCDEILFQAGTNISSVVPAGTKGARKAKLDYRLVAEKEAKALLDITLHTGRHHQIRVQLAHHGIPICGDAKYGKGGNGELSLCSYHIDFIHPENNRKMVYEICPRGKEITAMNNIPNLDNM